VAKVRGAAVAAFVQAGGLASKMDDVALGVSEACTSAVRHSAERSADGRIEIRAWVEDELFVVQVRDRAPSGSERGATGDLGTRLMVLVADTDIAARESGGTEVRLAFQMR
jgi:anti-sigma regulatory factor (Ser/Thr protein kinase)